MAFYYFKGGTGDFEVSRYLSKEIAIAQKLYTKGGGGGGQCIHFLKTLSAFSKKFKMGSMGIPSKILASS